MRNCEVRLWGSAIGAVSWDANLQIASFAYTQAFQRSGIEVAPLKMRLGPGVFRFPELARSSFHGLPGLLADSLPDRFGNAVIDAWLTQRGRKPGEFNPVERLAYIGTRGMGALEYWPATELDASPDQRIELEALVKLSSEVLAQRDGFRIQLDPSSNQEALSSLLSVGTSAGGARAKAVVAWNPRTREMRSGQTEIPTGFEHWLIKFDGVSGNRDKELADPLGFGLVELAYSHMARAAGIQMSDCLVLEENERRHFMTRRFDRVPVGQARTEQDQVEVNNLKLPFGKLHFCSLAGLAHLDYNLAGLHSYEGAFDVSSALGLSMTELEELYRRMIFNVLARNQDDHVKNIAYLMDKQGIWSLSPAFDLTFAYNPRGAWTHKHQMSIQGKQEGFEIEDLEAVASYAGLARGRGKKIRSEVQEAIAQWPELAAKAGLSEQWASRIATHLR